MSGDAAAGSRVATEGGAEWLARVLPRCNVERWRLRCPYLPGQQAVHIGTAGDLELTDACYERLLAHNFRRSGSVVYTPECPDCTACRNLRVLADEFRPSRTQRRCLRKNADLHVERYDQHEPTIERYLLYRRYVQVRHPGSEPDTTMSGSVDEFVGFLCWSGRVTTRCVEFRLGKQLVAVGVYDELIEALSAVYCYYAPELAKRSLGTLNILWLLEEARRSGRRYVYLGYYVAGCRKMNYKDRFRPYELWHPDGSWQRFEEPQDGIQEGGHSGV